ncbi:MAG: carbon monoxide dehydrogenase [Rhodobacteraceae bacterium]|nr:MAG: carbon monoxide dehydrogenase [Paracoccaceae bacterium]
MKLEGSQLIAADRAAVWAALNDPEVLKVCIPGCQSLEKTTDTHFHAVVKQKVGPVSATFNGEVELTDLNPPISYRIAGEGKGGAAGFAKGGADVTLSEVEGGTELVYHVDAKVGGKIAQLGARLIDGFARKQADAFFSKFKETVEGPQEAPSPATEASGAAAEGDAETAGAETAGAEPAPADGEKKGFWKRVFG